MRSAISWNLGTRVVSPDPDRESLVNDQVGRRTGSMGETKSGHANYASLSASFQLVTELFKQKTGAPMQVIPYKGANDSVLAVIRVR